VDRVDDRGARGEVEGVGLIGRGHASDPLVASMGVGLAGEFFDAEEERLGHDRGLFEVGAGADVERM
jgi:hypothetical protein